MKSIIIVGIVFFFCSVCYSTTIIIPDNYPTIQEGLDNAAAGDTVFVEAGTYNENLTVNKSLTIKGEAPRCTNVVGNGVGDVIDITADNVTIMKLSVSGAGNAPYSTEYDADAAVQLKGRSGCVIASCWIHDCPVVGIVMRNTDGNTIKNCLLSNNRFGVYLYEGYWEDPDYGSNINNMFLHNQFIDNTEKAIFFEHALEWHHENNLIQGNLFRGNHPGLYMFMCQSNIVAYNHFNDYPAYDIFFRQCIGGGSDNNFYCNYFIDHPSPVTQFEMTIGYNNWYSSTLELGNYWSFYEGEDLDGDGIGDEPVYIDFGDMNVIYDKYPLMNIPDMDSDGIADSVDNCIDTYNPDQTDANLNGVGDICDAFVCGDANKDLAVNIGDGVYIINFVFNGGSEPDPIEAGDNNCDGGTNVGDAVYLINYIFKSGPAPCCP